MSWFSHVSRAPGEEEQQQQQPAGGRRLADVLCSSPGLSGPTAGSPAQAAPHWGGRCPAPSAEDFPSAPHGVSSPPSLEKLSCAPLSSAQVGDPEPISYVSLQEQRCVLSWFAGWSGAQRERFLQDLLGKAVPGKVCTLLDSLSTLQVKDRLPNIFECQLRLWTQWFESWGEEERNHFLHMLEERDPVFVAHFYRSVAGTAGRD